MQQQYAGPAFALVTGLQHMHAQAIDALDKARADGGGKGDVGKGFDHSFCHFIGRT